MAKPGHLIRTFCAAVLCSMPAIIAASAAAPAPPASQAVVRWRDASMDEYRQHLIALASLVQACAKARNLASCDPALVGPDDRIPIPNEPNAERRMIRYGWLRVLFSRAEDPDQPAEKAPISKQSRPRDSALPPPPTTSQLLVDAEKRVAADLAQANGPSLNPAPHPVENGVMKQVLAGAEFRNLEGQTVRDTTLEKIENWLNRLFATASRFKARSRWVGFAVVSLFFISVCTALIWGLWRLERRWRVQLIPDAEPPASGAASARDWQLWLEDARTAAAQGHWRDAVHFLYWASISRLESRRLWPADRARTPREYLALLPPEDPRKSDLARLTGSFERTWYGGRPASQGDYIQAEDTAAALIGTGNSAVALEASAHEGGAA